MAGSSSEGRTSRTRSVGTKITEEEYARLEASVAESGLTVGEWCREVLLKASGQPAPLATATEETLLSELLALRTILLNLFYDVGQWGQSEATPAKSSFPRRGRVSPVRISAPVAHLFFDASKRQVRGARNGLPCHAARNQSRTGLFHHLGATARPNNARRKPGRSVKSGGGTEASGPKRKFRLVSRQTVPNVPQCPWAR